MVAGTVQRFLNGKKGLLVPSLSWSTIRGSPRKVQENLFSVDDHLKKTEPHQTGSGC